MGRIDAVIPDGLEQRLRIEVAKRLGGKKGDLLRAVTEAIELWVQHPVAEKLAESVKGDYKKNTALQRKGLDALGKMGYAALPSLGDIAADTLLYDAIREKAVELIDTIQSTPRTRQDLDSDLVRDA
jgi:hypothetical protein